MRVKIIGAGSIGNHLAHAARCLGWNVHLCDRDEAALTRTKNQIYPGRYSSWDDAIQLSDMSRTPSARYDLILIGTPPESHVPLALQALDERPRAILVEKPFCTPELNQSQELFERARHMNVPVFVGYDHAVGKASEKFVELISSGGLPPIQTLDVEFREHWGGIFAAHPWLSGPEDSYLGFSARGGGALGEHSHATNLWQHFAHEIGAGRVTEVQAMMDFVTNSAVSYDKVCMLNLRTEHGLTGRVIQDVVTSPPRKWARAQGAQGFVEWHCGHPPGCDAVFNGNGARHAVQEHMFPKTRPDDFMQELRHIEAALAGDPAKSSLFITRGLDTMLVVAAAHKSARERRTIDIDYSEGYTLAALK